MKYFKAIVLIPLSVFCLTSTGLCYAEDDVNAEPPVVEQQRAGSAIVQRGRAAMIADPQTILNLRKDMQQSAAARRAPILDEFEPGIPQEILDIDEMFELSQRLDQTTPKVFLAKFQSTAISFVDAYGKPWPIRKVASYLNGLVAIEKAVPERNGPAKEGEESSQGTDLNDPQAGSITVTALKHGVVGNITVYLYNLSTPISINLVGKAAMYHKTATIKIDDAGPQTDVSRIHENDGVVIGSKADADLNNALYGVSPLGSETMVVQGVEGKAWLKGDFIYLMTPVAVFSPQIFGASHGNGKYRAYKLAKTTEAIGTNTDGKTVVIKIMRHPSSDISEQNGLGGGTFK
ncbi:MULTISPECIES: DotH/IcmK family type IV secretion protein [Pseudomonas syringae group]|nr:MULTISPECIES: DotH/IcmK family type IV secretion protein [Pseudomonas syringae group]MDH4602455.1 hypothetical protein [Pseudomonas syringae pv. papulans]